MKISIINGDGTTTYVENMTPVTSLEEFSDSLTSATQALNDSQTETNATFAGTSLTVPTDLMSIFEEAADTYGVDVNLLTAIAKQESNFTADATSSSGAMGIMQLMPATAQGLGVSDAYDPYQNIMGGAKYIGQLLSRYDGDVSLALAAIQCRQWECSKIWRYSTFCRDTELCFKSAWLLSEWSRHSVTDQQCTGKCYRYGRAVRR